MSHINFNKRNGTELRYDAQLLKNGCHEHAGLAARHVKINKHESVLLQGGIEHRFVGDLLNRSQRREDERCEDAEKNFVIRFHESLLKDSDYCRRLRKLTSIFSIAEKDLLGHPIKLVQFEFLFILFFTKTANLL